MRMTGRRWLAALLCAVVWNPAQGASRIDRVEPGSWWIGMKDERLQLLVHGDEIGGLDVAIRHAGVTLASVERVENPNYLFVNLRIAPDAKPGTFSIELRDRNRRVATYPYALNAREPGSAERRGFGPGDVI
jgi:hypothetical protein